MNPPLAKLSPEASLYGDMACRMIGPSTQASGSSVGLSHSATTATDDVPRGEKETTGENLVRQPMPGEDKPAHQPAKGVENDYNDNYEISSRTEILYILRGMSEQGSLITFFFNHGYDFLLTTILNISADGSTMILDYGGDMKMNRKVLLTDRINCQARKDKVKIQFILHGVAVVRNEGRDAFLAAVPDSLIRLQRRTYYRVPTPRANPLAAIIPLRQADGPMLLLQAGVVDISGGGIGLRVPPGNPRLEKDMLLFGVTFALPKIGNVIVDMHVRNIHDETMPNGKIHQRAVCQFVNLPNPMMNLIQRYIFKIQRERIARIVTGVAVS